MYDKSKTKRIPKMLELLQQSESLKLQKQLNTNMNKINNLNINAFLKDDA